MKHEVHFKAKFLMSHFNVYFLLGVPLEKVHTDEKFHYRPRQHPNSKLGYFLQQETNAWSCATFNLSPRFSLYFGQSYEKEKRPNEQSSLQYSYKGFYKA